MYFLVHRRHDESAVGRNAGKKSEGVFFAIVFVPGKNVRLPHHDALGNGNERVGALVALGPVHVHAQRAAV